MLLALIGLVAEANISHAQNNQTRQVMRQKLRHSEALLAALVTSNWDNLDRNGLSLKALTTQLGWQALQLPEFNKYTNAFQRSTAALVEAARARDGEAALPAYNGLVSSCVECHRYVARSRIARNAPGAMSDPNGSGVWGEIGSPARFSARTRPDLRRAC